MSASHIHQSVIQTQKTKIWALLPIAFLIAGCSSPPIIPVVVSTVTAHSSVDDFHSKNIHLSAFPIENNNSPEWEKYKQKFSVQFRDRGLTITDVDAADYIAFISYGIDNGTTSQETYSYPIYGQTGGGTTYHYGSVSSYGSHGRYSGTSTQEPIYGVVGSKARTVNVTTYSRNLAMDIVTSESLKLGGSEKVYEGMLISRGSCAGMNEVIDELIEALFTKFPNGAGRVEVPGTFDC